MSKKEEVKQETVIRAKVLGLAETDNPEASLLTLFLGERDAQGNVLRVLAPCTCPFNTIGRDCDELCPHFMLPGSHATELQRGEQVPLYLKCVDADAYEMMYYAGRIGADGIEK